MNINRRMLWPKRKRMAGRGKRRLGAYRMKVRARYKRWLRWVQLPPHLWTQWTVLDIIAENALIDMCAAEDARFFAMIDRAVASGRRLYYRKR